MTALATPSHETPDTFATRHAVALSAAAAAAVLAGAFALDARMHGVAWVHAPLHSAMEAAGAMIALGLVMVLRLRRRVVGDDAPHYTWLAASLTVMGTLDLVHACTPVGPTFFWSRALPTLLGGVLAAGVWSTASEGRLAGLRAPRRTGPGLVAASALLSLPLAAALLFAPDGWAPGFDAELRYTVWARLINMVGGVGFLAAAVFLLRRARAGESGQRGVSRLYAGRGEATVLAAQCLLLGLAGLLFWVSEVWSPVWWLFHAVRLASYALALGAALQVYRGIEATQRGHLERELSAQMAELEAVRGEPS